MIIVATDDWLVVWQSTKTKLMRMTFVMLWYILSKSKGGVVRVYTVNLSSICWYDWTYSESVYKSLRFNHTEHVTGDNTWYLIHGGHSPIECRISSKIIHLNRTANYKAKMHLVWNIFAFYTVTVIKGFRSQNIPKSGIYLKYYLL